MKKRDVGLLVLLGLFLLSQSKSGKVTQPAGLQPAGGQANAPQRAVGPTPGAIRQGVQQGVQNQLPQQGGATVPGLEPASGTAQAGS